MLTDSILINRPVVVTSIGTRFCRLSGTALDFLLNLKKFFSKENGELVINVQSEKVAHERIKSRYARIKTRVNE